MAQLRETALFGGRISVCPVRIEVCGLYIDGLPYSEERRCRRARCSLLVHTHALWDANLAATQPLMPELHGEPQC